MEKLNYHILSNGEDTAASMHDFLVEWNNSSDFIIQLTSGSTGKPKPIRILKKMMVASAQATLDFFQLTRNDTALLCISPNFIGGKMMIVRAIVGGLKLFVSETSGNPLQGIKEQIDLTALVPLQIHNEIKNGNSLINFKNIIVGGAPVSSSLENAIAKLKSKVYSTFGMTETISHVALKRLNDKNEPFVAVGKTTFSFLNENLVISAPHLEIKNLVTNDAVELIDETRFHWLGRTDFVINSGGIKIHPEKIEKKLSTLITNRNILIYPTKNETLGEIVCLAIEGETIKENLDFNLALEKYEIPKEIKHLTSFVYTTNGKIDRKLTRLKITGEK